MANLTKVEKQILNIALINSKLTITDFYMSYKSKEIIKQTIDRFKTLGLISEDSVVAGNFIVDTEKIKAVLR